MKTLFMTLFLIPLAIACSPSPAEEGCWITHSNGVEVFHVKMPGNGDAIAMNPGDSYQISCAREINTSAVGDIISEDQRTLRIQAFPHNAELEIYPNERDAVYRGQPSPASADVWLALRKASNSAPIRGWAIGAVAGGALVSVVVALIWFISTRNQKPEQDLPPEEPMRF